MGCTWMYPRVQGTASSALFRLYRQQPADRICEPATVYCALRTAPLKTQYLCHGAGEGCGAGVDMVVYVLVLAPN